MSTNCIRCVTAKRTGLDLLCDACRTMREQGTSTFTDKWLLNGGPQDGAKVMRVGELMPLTVYVGPKWLGDGLAAWSAEPSERFPARYVQDGDGKYEFAGWHSTPAAAGRHDETR